jgi:hypothetical protein
VLVGSPSSAIEVFGQGECRRYGADDYGTHESNRHYCQKCGFSCEAHIDELILFVYKKYVDRLYAKNINEFRGAFDKDYFLLLVESSNKLEDIHGIS